MNALVPGPGRSGLLRDPADVSAALSIPFSDEQLAAITAPLEPGVIIAGAGSGKTTVMAARVVWLVGTGLVRPQEVLGLTFTRKAAAELSLRIRKALLKAGVLSPTGADEEGEQVVMTYDAFAGRLVAEHGLRLGAEPDPLLLTGAARFRLAARVVEAASGPLPMLSAFTTETVVDRVLALDAAMASHLVEPGQVEAHVRQMIAALDAAPVKSNGSPYKDIVDARNQVWQRKELLDLVAAYRVEKARQGAVEFSDQMATAARLAREAPAVAEAMRAQFRVVLLDEYQDTSSAQAILLRNLFSGPEASHGRGHAVTAVGDPFQAIYGWRGAAAGNILSFAHDFPAGDGTPAARYSLSVNRRSGRRILAAANAVAQRLRQEPAMVAAGATSVLEPGEGKGPGRVEVAQFATWPDEVAWICDEIVRAHDALAWRDIAVLARTNADLVALHTALTERDVPAEILGLGGLLGLPEIADLVATLRVLADPTANAALIRLLQGPRWAIGPADLVVLGRRAKALLRDGATASVADPDVDEGAMARALARQDDSQVASLLEAVVDPGAAPLSPAARERLGRFARELGGLRRHLGEPLPDLVRRVIATMGLEVEVEATVEGHRRARTTQLSAFLDAVARYVGEDPRASLSGLLAWLDDEQAHDVGLERAAPSGDDAVTLLTVHRAKGLEWELVFLPGLTAGTFPTRRSGDNWVKTAAVLPAPLRGDAAQIPQLGDVSAKGFARYAEELQTEARRGEDRLAYVAVTRARERLIASAHWWRPGAKTVREPSDYLTAIRAHADAVLVDVAQPGEGAVNPLLEARLPAMWPTPLDEEGASRRRESASLVRQAQARLGDVGPAVLARPGDADLAATVAGWDAAIDHLLAEARHHRRRVHDVPLPPSLTASQMMALQRNPQRFAAELLRPMPRAPQPAAAFGTRFHAWVEQRFGQLTLPEVDDALLVEEPAADDEADFRELCATFERGRFGDRAPVAIEQPFTLLLGRDGRAHPVRGRIDAVYADGDGWLVVDWKTSRQETADPLQLALYRVAWAELQGVEISRVRAGFHWVRTDRFTEHTELPGRAELEAMFASLTAAPGEPERAATA